LTDPNLAARLTWRAVSFPVVDEPSPSGAITLLEAANFKTLASGVPRAASSLERRGSVDDPMV
jgi:hypothetical protein